MFQKQKKSNSKSVTRKKSAIKIPEKVNEVLNKLQDSLECISKARDQHDLNTSINLELEGDRSWRRLKHLINLQLYRKTVSKAN